LNLLSPALRLRARVLTHDWSLRLALNHLALSGLLLLHHHLTLLFGMPLCFHLLSLLRRLSLDGSSSLSALTSLDLSLLLLNECLGRSSLLLSLLTSLLLLQHLLLLLLAHLLTLDSSHLRTLRSRLLLRGGLLTLESSLLSHLILLSLLLSTRRRSLLALESSLLSHLLLLGLLRRLLLSGRRSLLLTFQPSLLLHLLTRLLHLSLRGDLRLLLIRSHLFAHKLPHLSFGRPITLRCSSGKRCHLRLLLRLSQWLSQAIRSPEARDLSRVIDLQLIRLTFG